MDCVKNDAFIRSASCSKMHRRMTNVPHRLITEKKGK